MSGLADRAVLWAGRETSSIDKVRLFCSEGLSRSEVMSGLAACLGNREKVELTLSKRLPDSPFALAGLSLNLDGGYLNPVGLHCGID